MPKKLPVLYSHNFLPQLFDIFTQIYLSYLRHFATLFPGKTLPVVQGKLHISFLRHSKLKVLRPCQLKLQYQLRAIKEPRNTISQFKKIKMITKVWRVIIVIMMNRWVYSLVSSSSTMFRVFILWHFLFKAVASNFVGFFHMMPFYSRFTPIYTAVKRHLQDFCINWME